MPSLEEMEQALKEHLGEEISQSIQTVVFASSADVMGLAVSQRRDNARWWNSHADWRTSLFQAESGDTLFQKSVFFLELDCKVTQMSFQ